MDTVVKALFFSFCLVVFLGAVFIYSGSFNVAATSPHWPVTSWAVEAVRMHSIKMHAAGVTAPGNLDDPAEVVLGTEHFAAHCAVCHGAPGVPKGEIAEGLYPQPADLAVAARRYTSAELFWIIKNGIKMTGMPSWSDHSDAEIWGTVAFLKKLGAGMSEQDYGKLVMASVALGGHHHHGCAEEPAFMETKGMDMKGMDMHEAPGQGKDGKPSMPDPASSGGGDHHSH